jgi:hypothetical protein
MHAILYICMYIRVCVHNYMHTNFLQGQGAEGGEHDYERLQEGQAHTEERLSLSLSLSLV